MIRKNKRPGNNKIKLEQTKKLANAKLGYTGPGNLINAKATNKVPGDTNPPPTRKATDKPVGGKPPGTSLGY